MSRRDSDSKRHHSRFDREPSPKRYRRDGKQERERGGERERERERERDRDRERERVTTNGGGGHVDRDQRNHLPHHSKQVNRDAAAAAAAAADKKSNDHNEAASKHSSDPTQPPRSHSYYKHGEQGSAGQVGRSGGRREAGGKVLTQSREHNERVDRSQNKELRDEKSHSKLDDNFQRRDGFPERKDDQPPTTRRRPAFREKKIPVDSGEVNPATAVGVKSSQTDHPSERNERKEEKSSDPNQLDRPEKQPADDRVPNRNGARKDGFSSRVRYGGSGGNGYYSGRDKFHGRQGYQPSKTRAEKWKHDLYQEVNKDPIPRGEDDQIAKLEALLAS